VIARWGAGCRGKVSKGEGTLVGLDRGCSLCRREPCHIEPFGLSPPERTAGHDMVAASPSCQWQRGGRPGTVTWTQTRNRHGKREASQRIRHAACPRRSRGAGAAEGQPRRRRGPLALIFAAAARSMCDSKVEVGALRLFQARFVRRDDRPAGTGNRGAGMPPRGVGVESGSWREAAGSSMRLGACSHD